MTWHPLEKLINLHDGYRRVFNLAGRQLMLLQERGRCHLVGAHCPHYGQSLAEAHVVEGTLTCPLHGYCFDLATGHGRDGSGAAVSQQLPCYKLEYRERDIGVWLG
jgi:nitrite reductase/ring-hydroxylating ferredoxin subunit